jgi:hypothetical protein
VAFYFPPQLERNVGGVIEFIRRHRLMMRVEVVDILDTMSYKYAVSEGIFWKTPELSTVGPIVQDHTSNTGEFRH